MKINVMDMKPYTHIHLAFGHVTRSFALDVSHIQVQWELFKELLGVKKILSLGGWSFSTEPATYSIFRDSVKPANRGKFIANIVSFVKEHGLDGIDIDWECRYPTVFLTRKFVNPTHRSCCARHPKHSSRYVICQFLAVPPLCLMGYP